MKIVKLFFVISLALLYYSCSDNEVKPKGVTFPLKNGNYWIYRTTVTSADGVVSVFPYLDSVWVQGDTVINSIKYWKEIGTLRGTIYLRDSGDCVLMKELTYEQIIFSTNRKDTLMNTPPVCKIITDVNQSTKVPAGVFLTNNCRTLLRKDPSDTGHNSDFPSFSKDFDTSEQYLCSERVGLVKNIYYYLGGTVEYELVRYKLN
jgi:hypothetical protein